MYSITPSQYTKGIIVKISQSVNNIHNGLRKGLWALGRELESNSKTKIKNPPKSGRYYIYKGRRIQASAPGEYPANRSGNLRRSINFLVQGNDKLIFGANADYSSYLELGTIKMKKRSFLKRTINEKKSESTVGNIVFKELIR